MKIVWHLSFSVHSKSCISLWLLSFSYNILSTIAFILQYQIWEQRLHGLQSKKYSPYAPLQKVLLTPDVLDHHKLLSRSNLSQHPDWWFVRSRELINVSCIKYCCKIFTIQMHATGFLLLHANKIESTNFFVFLQSLTPRLIFGTWNLQKTFLNRNCKLQWEYIIPKKKVILQSFLKIWNRCLCWNLENYTNVPFKL